MVTYGASAEPNGSREKEQKENTQSSKKGTKGKDTGKEEKENG